jgi:hypothetical protein
MIFLACVLRLAVTEGPVLLLHLDKIDDDIFAPQSQTLMQAVGHSLVEGALHIKSPPLVHRHLNDDCVLGTLDSQVSRIDDQATGRVLGNDLEAVVLRSFQSSRESRSRAYFSPPNPPLAPCIRCAATTPAIPPWR